MGHKARRTEPKAAKRAFERAHGLYHDHAHGAPNVSSTGAAFMLGEPLTSEQRAACLADLRSGDILRAQNATLALGNERSEEVLDALLEAIAKGAASAVGTSLLPFVDDPRVRPALVDALAQQRPDRLANVAQAVGLVGGTGACDVLRRRLVELLDDRATFLDAEFTNWFAFSASSVAHALLRLDPESIDAAQALLQLMDHPCEKNRTRAEWVAAEVVCDSEYGHTAPVVLLERELARRFERTPEQVSIKTLTALLRWDGKRVRPECERRLTIPDPEARRTMWHCLTESGSGWAAMMAVRAMSRWVEEPADSKTLLFCIQLLGSLVPPLLAERVLREWLASDSPGIRASAIATLEDVAPDLARKLAREALRGEPDPALRRRLEPYARWSAARRFSRRAPARRRSAPRRDR